MHFEACPLPQEYDSVNRTLACYPYHWNPFSSTGHDLTRLHNEKNVLEKGLADCVTYLQVLRKKQAENARKVAVVSAISQKKKKKAQQIKRHLDIEIKNRERNEAALLNNLQACKTNILITEMKAYHTSSLSLYTFDAASTSSLHTPTLCSFSGSEATNVSWQGWTDEAAVSPFQRHGSNPFFVEDIAPDAYIKDLRHDSVAEKEVRRPPQLHRNVEELSSFLPVPPNTAHSLSQHSSILSPAATEFRPTLASKSQHSPLPQSQSKFKRLSVSMSKNTGCVELLQKRRSSEAEICTQHQQVSAGVRQDRHHLLHQTWCNTTPQRTPQKDAGAQMSKQRARSL
jgi:hypothetical protein